MFSLKYTFTMKNSIIILFVMCCLFPVTVNVSAQSNPKYPVKYEELTTPEFIEAVKLSGATCIIPIGV